MKDKSIWVLFSIENQYDQPEANLEAWWFKKPSIRQIADVIGWKARGCWGMLKGMEMRIGGADYRLERIPEGKYTKRG